MSTSRKKVILRTATNTLIPGYLPLTGMLDHSAARPTVEVLDLAGRMNQVALSTVRWIAYVRDFNLDDQHDPERLSRRAFLARPRTEGLWVRVTMTGGDFIEGLAPTNKALLDGVMEDQGVFLNPPDPRSNTQRLYLPWSSMVAFELQAVITTPSQSKPARPLLKSGKLSQESLFPQ